MPGGAKGTRTPDPLLAKQVLFQLSYSPGKPQVTRLLRDRSIPPTADALVAVVLGSESPLAATGG